MTVIDVLDMEFTAHAFSGGLVENLVTDTQSGSARRIAGAAIGCQQCIIVHNRCKILLQGWGETALTVVPERSVATRTGACLSNKTRFVALPPHLRAF